MLFITAALSRGALELGPGQYTQVSHSAGWDLNHGPLEYELGIPTVFCYSLFGFYLKLIIQWSRIVPVKLIVA
jgi:hypothetical protein